MVVSGGGVFIPGDLEKRQCSAANHGVPPCSAPAPRSCWDLGLLVVLATILSSGCTSTKPPVAAAVVPRPAALPLEWDRLIPVSVERIDAEELKAQAEANDAMGLPPKFAVKKEPSEPVTLEKGERTELPVGVRRTRLRFYAPGARNISLEFSKVELPNTARITLYDANGEARYRSLTAGDVSKDKRLGTPVLEGDQLLLEVDVTDSEADRAFLQLQSVYSGFRFFEYKHSLPCNVDVACARSSGYASADTIEKLARSVAMVKARDTVCTGFLINNTKGDYEPLFMTAAHCRIDSDAAGVAEFYWNRQKKACTGDDYAYGDFQSGAKFEATYPESDFTLLLLDEAPLEAYRPFFAGWDSRDPKRFAPDRTPYAFTVHHPQEDAKKVSTLTLKEAPTSGTFVAKDGAFFASDPSPGFLKRLFGKKREPNHWYFSEFADGTSERGSSGAPLFDEKGHVFGELHGALKKKEKGDVDRCKSKETIFGMLSAAWKGDTSKGPWLSDKLDPGERRVEVLAGVEPDYKCAEASMLEIRADESVLPGSTRNKAVVENLKPYSRSRRLNWVVTGGEQTKGSRADEAIEFSAPVKGKGEVVLTVTQVVPPCTFTGERRVHVSSADKEPVGTVGTAGAAGTADEGDRRTGTGGDDANQKLSASETPVSRPLGTIYFATGSWVVRKEGRDVIARVAPDIQENESGEVTLIGRCDRRGTDTYNDWLGRKRAEAVSKALREAGVTVGASPHSRGKKDATGQNAEGWRRDRRVDIVAETARTEQVHQGN